MKVELLDSCASDLDVVNAARVSFAQESDYEPCVSCESEAMKIVDGKIIDCPACRGVGGVLGKRDAGLIGFLIRERHGTPFEHGFFKFRVEAPIFVFREWHRHRVGHSYNEMSGRYVELEERFYYPERLREQFGKPGAYEYRQMEDSDVEERCMEIMEEAYEAAWSAYQALLRDGVAKEQARAVLPLGIYSQMIWSCNPRSLMHFCGLRNHKYAQAEIRELAEQAETALRDTMPVTWEAFLANDRRAP